MNVNLTLIVLLAKYLKIRPKTPKKWGNMWKVEKKPAYDVSFRLKYIYL